MNEMILHNANVLVRMVFYGLWAWIFYFDGLHLSLPMRSFLNMLVLADIITWFAYQVYLLPRMVVQLGIGTVVNMVVMYFLFRDAKALVPEYLGMQAMAIMVFLSVAAVKGFYYVLIEMDSRRRYSE
ncbi:MAG: hypothetical protein KKG47_16305 [Proteobacteria bacterium]|nr:hypothetical protein [Pseudomonadota bacterium]MBU1737573.1 hypothetical protein [Pseudomonadota bacterium]